MTSLRSLLPQLEVHLAEQHAPIVGHLRPGADRRQIEAALGERGVAPSEELLTWWGWHDGTDLAERYGGTFVPQPGNRLLTSWHLASVAESVDTYDLMQRIWEGTLPPGWWPVLGMSVPAQLCADTAGSGALFLVDVHSGLPDDPPQPLADSLTDFIRLLLDLFEAGAVVPSSSSPSGGLQLDVARLPRQLRFTEYW